MPMRSPKWPLSRALLRDAPETAGVYALWHGTELVYIGCAHGGRETLRRSLAEQLRTVPPSRHPTHFSWEITSRPTQRERELLLEYRELHARAPRWNRRGGLQAA